MNVLSDKAQMVLAHCEDEAWRNLESGDAHSEEDIAADIVQWLYTVYRVHAHSDGRDNDVLKGDSK
jgi:hypothetical protein